MFNNWFEDWDNMFFDYKKYKNNCIKYYDKVKKFANDYVNDVTEYSKEQYNKFTNKNWTDE